MQVSRHRSGSGWWEMARAPAHAALANDVTGYCGYLERGDRAVRRREVPTGRVALIISFGDAIEIATMTASPQQTPTSVRSFVAGMHEGHAVTEHAGRQHGVEVELGPLAARRLLGVPMDEVANQVVPLEAIRGRSVDVLAERLAAAPTWQARFDILDHALLGWLADAPQSDAAVAWGWRRLQQSRGLVPIEALVREVGWSRRHFGARFRSHVGLAPKAAARVLRFDHAAELLLADRRPTVSAVAAATGYADHSHLIREFRALAGCTPTELVAARLPAGGGVGAG